MNELDIWCAAQAMITAYGNGAEEHAKKRYQTLRDGRDIEGAAVWDHIIRKIQDLRNTSGTVN